MKIKKNEQGEFDTIEFDTDLEDEQLQNDEQYILLNDFRSKFTDKEDIKMNNMKKTDH